MTFEVECVLWKYCLYRIFIEGKAEDRDLGQCQKSCSIINSLRRTDSRVGVGWPSKPNSYLKTGHAGA